MTDMTDLERKIRDLEAELRRETDALGAERQRRESMQAERDDWIKKYQHERELVTMAQAREAVAGDNEDSARARIAELERDVNALEERLEEADRACEDEIQRRDHYADAIQRIHIALGGDGEWRARIPAQPPPNSGSLGVDAEVMARDVVSRATAAEAERDTLRRNLHESVRLRRDVEAERDEWLAEGRRLLEVAYGEGIACVASRPVHISGLRQFIRDALDARADTAAAEARIAELERELLAQEEARGLLLHDVRPVAADEPPERMIPCQHAVSTLRIARSFDRRARPRHDKEQG